MPPDRTIARLADMLDSARAILEFLQGKNYAEYLQSRLLRSAVVREIEIIGEAARLMPDDFKAAHPEIPWKSITVQRHVLAHDYDTINHEKIWRVATIHIPELIGLLEPLIPPSASA